MSERGTCESKSAKRNAKRREAKRKKKQAMEATTIATTTTTTTATTATTAQGHKPADTEDSIPWKPIKDFPRIPREQEFDLICVLDFEAQCEKDVRLHPQEIIEFPSVLLDIKNQRVAEFHTYVKPEVYPKLTRFCTELTGITQDLVDNGISLQEAIGQHLKFLKGVGMENRKLVFVTCGHWDLKTCLPNQMKYLRQAVPDCYHSWTNIKKSYQQLYRLKKLGGMVDMLNRLGIPLEGRHHSGIDDSRNIAKIALAMLRDGWVVKENGSYAMFNKR